MWSSVLFGLCAITGVVSQSFDSPALDWIDKDEKTGAYQFGYSTGDEGKHYHTASATADNTITGRFGYKDPVAGGDLQTVYTAGRRGFRARGPHIARRMDLSQNRPPFARPNNDGKYIPELDNIFDPNEDRGYDFSYRTATHSKEEHADRAGDAHGRYSYVDDVGNRHTVDYIAGAGTGFVVTNAVPDTFARARGGPLYYVGNRPDRPKIRGFHAIQKALDGSYRFEASGPDQKRSEVSDALGNRRGTYTYLDDKGIQHTVEYIAGPNIGYKVINNKKGTAYNPVLPFFPDSSTLGPFAVPFPTTTLRPIASSPAFGGGAATFPAKPTEPSVPASTPATESTSAGRPSTLPDAPYAFPSGSAATGGDATKFPEPGSTKPTSLFTSSDVPDKTWDYPSKPRPEYPFFKPVHRPFGDGLNTAESGSGVARPECTVNGTSAEGHGPRRTSKSHYRGSIKFGGIRRSENDKEKREEYLEIPPGVAVRAHVQSLDIVPFNKRFASPGEALESFSKRRDTQ